MIRLSAIAAMAAIFLVMPEAAVAQVSAPYAVQGRVSAADGGWDFATVDPVHGRLFVARGTGVTMMDLASQHVTEFANVAEHGHQVLAINDGNTLFVTSGNSNTARFVDAATGAVLTTLSTGIKPDAALYDAATGRIAVMNAGDGTVTLIDAKSRAIAGTIAVGGALEFGVALGDGTALINIEDKGEIARVDLKSAKRTGTIALPGCEGPTGLALVAGGARIISACANGKALVLDPKDGRLIATLSVGADPDAVIADDARHLAFIPCGGSGTLIALDTRNADAITVSAVIPTQVGAKTGAIDPRDGRLYLPTATLAAPAPGAKRGKPVPGSFVILIVASKP